MLKTFLSFILIIIFLQNTYAGSPLNSIKNGFENIPAPFYLIKKTAQKISKFGLKKILFGVTVAGMLSEFYISEDDSHVKENKKRKESTIRKIKSKGFININGISVSEAKKRALEDALYFASVKAGVKVHGFSSIDNQTNLNENFVVEPDNKILDYKIINSYQDKEAYIVEIEAVVGDPNNKVSFCKDRAITNLAEFKGKKFYNTNIDAAHDNLVNILVEKTSYNLDKNKNINLRNRKNNYYNFNRDNFDLSYDYKTLVNGQPKVDFGEFIYIPSVKVFKTKIYPKTFLIKDNGFPILNNYQILDTDALAIDFEIKIYDGSSNKLIELIEERYLVPLNIDSNFEFIEMFSKNDNEYLNLEIENIAYDISNIIEKKLSCRPISAKINLKDDQLFVLIGRNNGLRKNQLAIVENNDLNNWTMLSVESVNEKSATLVPLNSSIKLENFSGKKTRFLE